MCIAEACKAFLPVDCFPLLENSSRLREPAVPWFSTAVSGPRVFNSLSSSGLAFHARDSPDRLSTVTAAYMAATPPPPLPIARHEQFPGSGHGCCATFVPCFPPPL